MIKRFIKKVSDKILGKSAPAKPAHAAHKVEKNKPADEHNQWKPGGKVEPVAPSAHAAHQKPAESRSERGPRPDHRGPRPERPRHDGPRHDGPRHEGTRRDGPRRDGPRHDGPRPDRPPRGDHGPRHDRPPSQRDRNASGHIEKAPVSTVPFDPATFAVPVVEGKTRFHDFDLPEQLMHAIADLKFEYCTPIQAESLPVTLTGRDLFGKAQTGTGKTAAFLIAAFTKLLKNPLAEPAKRGTPRVLILAPTRELCLQIHKDAMALGKYCGFNVVAVFGGMDYDKQRMQLTENPVDIVVATPGRLIDFKQKQDIHLSKVEILVIDEADRMLDMGFIPDVRDIIYSTPPKGKRQTLFYSATMTDDILRLSSAWTHEPVSIEIQPESVAVDTVEQQVYIVTAQEKFALLYNMLQQPDVTRVIVFANRRDEAERLCDALKRFKIESCLLSGAVAQDKRVRVLEGFRNGQYRVLVATDVAGRGIHVDSVSHVVNFNLPDDPEDYVHRIGRTGRAGASGQSFSFACEDDSFAIPALEKFLGRPLKFIHPEDAQLKLPEGLDGQTAPAGMTQRRMGGGGRPPFRRGGPRRGPPRR